MIEMPRGPIKFQATVVKPYYSEFGEVTFVTDDYNRREAEDTEYQLLKEKTTTGKRRGRPLGSKNKPKVVTAVNQNVSFDPTLKRIKDDGDSSNNDVVDNETFVTAKEIAAYNLAVELRKKDIIKTPEELFKASNKAEIDALINANVFQFKLYDPDTHKNQLFNSRLVREVKGKETNEPYEKSRLVVAECEDMTKATLLI